MRILALDPAARCGYAFGIRRDQVEASGVWQLGADAAGRLERLEDYLTRAIAKWKPEVVAYESATFGSHHLHAMRRHNELAGVIELVAVRSSLPCWSYNPNSWKAKALGSGRAQKPAVIRGLKTYFGIDVSSEDEADAIGVYLAAQMGPPPEPVKKRERRVVKELAKRQGVLFGRRR